MPKQKLLKIKRAHKKGTVDTKDILQYFLNEMVQHIKKALFDHRPACKRAEFYSECWSGGFSWVQNWSEKGTGCQCCEITGAATCVPGDTWACRAGQLSSTARPAPLLAPQRCRFLFCWEGLGPSENTPDLLQTASQPLPLHSLPLQHRLLVQFIPHLILVSPGRSAIKIKI